jgi:hypothetical protein
MIQGDDIVVDIDRFYRLPRPVKRPRVSYWQKRGFAAHPVKSEHLTIRAVKPDLAQCLMHHRRVCAGRLNSRDHVVTAAGTEIVADCRNC